MAGRGAPPKLPSQRHGAHKPLRGEWQSSPGVGWQHGPIPDPPADLQPPTLAAWDVWFKSWPASHWTPADLPGLRTVAQLLDAVVRGNLTRTTELRVWMDGLGLSPKGQQDRRWLPPTAGPVDLAPAIDVYRRLRAAAPAPESDLAEYLAAQAERRAKREARAKREPQQGAAHGR